MLRAIAPLGCGVICAPREPLAFQDCAKAHRDADRALVRRRATLANDREEVEVVHERGVLVGIEHARQLAEENGRAQRLDGWQRDPDAIASQLDHKIERVVGTEPRDRERIRWLREGAPLSLRDEVELARALRAAATERGRIGGVVLSKDAALAVADLSTTTRRCGLAIGSPGSCRRWCERMSCAE